MGKKVFDFKQHTMLMGVPRRTPIISLASSVDERSDHEEDNKPKEQVLIKRTPYLGLITDLGGMPVDDYRTDAERNKDYWSPIGGAWERNKSQWNNGLHLLQGLGKTMGVAAAVASIANPEALGVANFVLKAHNNPYVLAGMSSLGLADAAYRVKTGNIGKNFDEDVFTALEFVPYLNMTIKSGNNAMKAVRDLKHLPGLIKRKWNANKRINELLYLQNYQNLQAANDRYDKAVQKLQTEFDLLANVIALNKQEINKESWEKRRRLLTILLRRDYLGSPLPVSGKITQGQPNKESVIDFTKLSPENWKKLFDVYPDLKGRVEFIDGKPYFNDGSGSFYTSVNTTSKLIPVYGTDLQITASIITPSGDKVPMSNYSTINRLEGQIIPAKEDVKVNDNYVRALLHNIDYVLNEFPGSVPFGSSVGVAKANFPHITDDIDLFITNDRLSAIELKYGPRTGWYLKVGDKDGTGVLTYTLELENGRYGDAGKIDLNVLYSDPNTGNAIGQRSLELFRQLFPDDYLKALLEAERTKTPIVITKTPEELINSVTPSKTILDSFESSKEKHIPRSLIYLLDGDPDLVYEGLKKYYESFLGSKVRHAPVHESLFTDYADNRRLLDLMGILELNVDKIASDPKRMRNLFQYWWMENTSYGRGTKTDGDFFGNAKKYMTEMGGTGGQAAGPGLNTVLFGNSGHGGGDNAYSIVLPEIRGIVEGMSPQEIFNAVRKSQGHGLSLTLEQIQSINEILNKYNIPSITETPTYQPLINLFNRLGYNKEGVYGISDIIGINGVVTGPYGNSMYYGGVRPFNKSGDLLSFIKTSYNNGSGIYPIPHYERLRNSSLSKPVNYKPAGLNKITGPTKHFDAWYNNNHDLLYKPENLHKLADNRVFRQTNEKISKLDEQLDILYKLLKSNKATEHDKMLKAYDINATRSWKLDDLARKVKNSRLLPLTIGVGASAVGGIYGLLLWLPVGDKEIWKRYLPEYKDFIDSLTPEEIEYIRNHHIRNASWDLLKSYKELILELKDLKFDERRKK